MNVGVANLVTSTDLGHEKGHQYRASTFNLLLSNWNKRKVNDLWKVCHIQNRIRVNWYNEVFVSLQENEQVQRPLHSLAIRQCQLRTVFCNAVKTSICKEILLNK